jgi:hypothetical protein
MTRNFQEVISPDQEHSNPVSPDDRDTIQMLVTMNGLSNISDNFEVLENDGLGTEKKYDWSARIFKVYIFFCFTIYFTKLFIDIFFSCIFIFIFIYFLLTDSQ